MIECRKCGARQGEHERCIICGAAMAPNMTRSKTTSAEPSYSSDWEKNDLQIKHTYDKKSLEQKKVVTIQKKHGIRLLAVVLICTILVGVGVCGLLRASSNRVNQIEKERQS